MATTQKQSFSDLLHQAVINLDEEIAALQNTRAQLITMINQPANGGYTVEATPTKKRRLTPAGRKRLSEAAKARWENDRRAKSQNLKTAGKKSHLNHPASGSAMETATPEKRRLSPEGKKRISDAAKARWARLRKEKSQKIKAAGKKHPQQKGRQV